MKDDEEIDDFQSTSGGHFRIKIWKKRHANVLNIFIFFKCREGGKDGRDGKGGRGGSWWSIIDRKLQYTENGGIVVVFESLF
jgi:hypothetical protein